MQKARDEGEDWEASIQGASPSQNLEACTNQEALSDPLVVKEGMTKLANQWPRT